MAFIFSYGIVIATPTSYRMLQDISNLALRIALPGDIILGCELLKQPCFHRGLGVLDLVSHMYFFDALTGHHRIEGEVQ